MVLRRLCFVRITPMDSDVGEKMNAPYIYSSFSPAFCNKRERLFLNRSENPIGKHPISNVSKLPYTVGQHHFPIKIFRHYFFDWNPVGKCHVFRLFSESENVIGKCNRKMFPSLQSDVSSYSSNAVAVHKYHDTYICTNSRQAGQHQRRRGAAVLLATAAHVCM